MSMMDGGQFDPNNPEDRACYIASSAGFVGNHWAHIDPNTRARLGHAIEDMFPGVEYEDLFAKLQGVDYRPLRASLLAQVIWLPKLDLEAIRNRALETIKAQPPRKA
jgi:hypothetical protein